ncbi:hypothetical protein JAAARDRAFT_40386 [Jaapia argillacea MUCL 33604]|uniref:Uncharacterized protein n=1 Tax=Jaapia argillacea MUCL 33604 TaxID=933084 RepID=A0A067PPL5_9AGAM|nr:hypothetical protein JAAARDRAFT_40386 [Jaapia argillacea MUCL 33604]
MEFSITCFSPSSTSPLRLLEFVICRTQFPPNDSTIRELCPPSYDARPHQSPPETTFRNVVGLIPVQIVSSTRGLVFTLLGVCRPDLNDDGGPSLRHATSCGKTLNLVLESFSLG